jgi:hypothetical protein
LLLMPVLVSLASTPCSPVAGPLCYFWRFLNLEGKKGSFLKRNTH